jgi:Sec-independent protein translocase protein TatA
MRQDVDGLLFSLEVSVRYHISRRDFLNGVAKFLDVASLLSAGGLLLIMVSAATVLDRAALEMGLAALLLVISVYGVVSGPSKVAMVHQDCASKFRALKNRIRQYLAEMTTSDEGSSLDRQFAQWVFERESIEQGEPAIYCALQDEIRFATAIAEGRPAGNGDRPIWLKRQLRQILRFDDTPSVGLN